jgi:nicotinic acid mononucleotide adenylyltransferase
VVGEREAARPAAPVAQDLDELLALRAALAGLDPAGPPTAVTVQAPRGEDGVALDGAAQGGRIGILPGSFNPLTNAHAALARVALAAGGLDAIYLALSRRTVDKEGVDRPSQADRALVLCRYARRQPRHGVLLFNRGLYAEQAEAARARFPGARELAFVVGFDKARQIFDPGYYTDREAALARLFAAATLLVAPRGPDGAAAFAELLGRPENRAYLARVRLLPFDPAYAGDSATEVRAAAQSGRSVDELVPPETLAFLAEARPYDAPEIGADGARRDHYAEREAWIESLAGQRRALDAASGPASDVAAGPAAHSARS